jgi:hypothetical protein
MILFLFRDAMLVRKMGPHPQYSVPKTEAHIVLEVLTEQTVRSTNMFLEKLTVKSATHIRVFGNTHADQEQENKELRRKQEEELAAVKKAQEDETLANEKRHKEIVENLNFIMTLSREDHPMVTTKLHHQRDILSS